MTAMAQRLNALNLSQGFPDFPAPPDLLQASAKQLWMDITNMHQVMVYSAYVEEVAKLFVQRDQLKFDPVTGNHHYPRCNHWYF